MTQPNALNTEQCIIIDSDCRDKERFPEAAHYTMHLPLFQRHVTYISGISYTMPKSAMTIEDRAAIRAGRDNFTLTGNNLFSLMENMIITAGVNDTIQFREYNSDTASTTFTATLPATLQLITNITYGGGVPAGFVQVNMPAAHNLQVGDIFRIIDHPSGANYAPFTNNINNTTMASTYTVSTVISATAFQFPFVVAGVGPSPNPVAPLTFAGFVQVDVATPTALAALVQEKMNGVVGAANTYTVTYSTITGMFQITRNTGVMAFDLLMSTSRAAGLLGYFPIDMKWQPIINTGGFGSTTSMLGTFAQLAQNQPPIYTASLPTNATPICNIQPSTYATGAALATAATTAAASNTPQVTAANQTIVFQDSTGNVVTTTLTLGFYTPTAFATMVGARMTAADAALAANTFTVTFNASTSPFTAQTYTIASNGAAFELLFDNAANTCAALLGFDTERYSGAVSYTSVNALRYATQQRLSQQYTVIDLTGRRMYRIERNGNFGAVVTSTATAGGGGADPITTINFATGHGLAVNDVIQVIGSNANVVAVPLWVGLHVVNTVPTATSITIHMGVTGVNVPTVDRVETVPRVFNLLFAPYTDMTQQQQQIYNANRPSALAPRLVNNAAKTLGFNGGCVLGVVTSTDGTGQYILDPDPFVVLSVIIEGAAGVDLYFDPAIEKRGAVGGGAMSDKREGFAVIPMTISGIPFGDSVVYDSEAFRLDLPQESALKSVTVQVLRSNGDLYPTHQQNHKIILRALVK